MKSGIKTTEFWLVVITNLITVVGALKGIIPAEIATITITVLTAIYTVLRSLVKQPDITTIVESRR